MLEKIANAMRGHSSEDREGVTMRASWKGVTIAESEDTVVVEGNHYFPRSSLDPAAVQPSDTTTTCPWKGEASYLSIIAEADLNKDAAWYYSNPNEAAEQIRGRVAFWRGVQVEPVNEIA